MSPGFPHSAAKKNLIMDPAQFTGRGGKSATQVLKGRDMKLIAGENLISA